MKRFASPLWRVLGSFISWFVFSLSFSLLYVGSATVMGLGGFCASGGPYVIDAGEAHASSPTRTFAIGAPLRVRVVSTDPVLGRIELALVEGAG